jgi:hypothetical protein
VYPNVNSWNSCCEVVEEMVGGLIADQAMRPSVEVAA